MTKKSVSLTVRTALSQFTALKRVMKTCMHIIRFHLQALDKSDWDLARELVRFLRTIDPDEMTGGSQDGGQMVTSAALRGMTSCPQSPPISAISAEEEISHLLGTLQGNFCVSLVLLLWASTPITTSRVCVNVLGRTNQLESEKRILAIMMRFSDTFTK